MSKIIEIRTDRLLLRQWCHDDYTPFATLNSDAEVMRYFPSRLNRKESDALASRIEALIAERGWGFWAVELIAQNSFIGFVGLHETTYEIPVTPCIEIGWRLAQEYWGNGYATEAARASLDVAFTKLNIETIYSFTAVSNVKSRAVMEELNMVNMQRNFDHPMVPQDSPLREHVLYKIKNPHDDGHGRDRAT
ncbi:MAG: GNAT family N-acetyltransferase [Thiohalomonadales bacterium]